MLFPLALAAILGFVYADYPCICNYHVERGVYAQPTQTSTAPLGFLYEFDCKPIVQQSGTLPSGWAALAFDGRITYVLTDTDVRAETCPGEPSPTDIIKTTTPTSTMSSVPVPPTSTTEQSSSEIPTSSVDMHSTSSAIPANVKPSSSIHSTDYTFPSSKMHKSSTATSASAATSSSSAIPHSSVTVMSSSSTPPTSTLTPTTSPMHSMSSTTSTTSTHPTSSATPSSTAPPTSTITTSSLVYSTPSTTSATSSPTTVSTESAMTTHRVLSGNTDRCSPNLHTYTHNDKGLLAQYDDSCYELVPVRKSWVHAERNCIQKGGHLFHISNSDDELFIYEMLRVHFPNHTVWTGLHDRIHEEHFEWSSGDPVTYTHWKPGRKSNFYHHNSEDCVVFVPYIHHGDWDDIPCGSSLLGLDVGERYPFICQFDAGIPVSPGLTTPQPSYVPGHTGLCSSSLHYYARRDGGTLGQFDRSCYELIPHHYNWRHAERLCEGRGGFLAHIQNADQQTFIQAFMMKYNTEYAVWIGLHDLRNEEHFEWISGSDVTYTNWIPGRKGNYQSHHLEDCVALIPYKHGMWDDIPCGSTSIFGRDSGETHYVLCQYETLGVPSPVGK